MIIAGVVTKKLRPHQDDRGFFCELLRKSDPCFGKFAQLSHSMVKPGVLKAWHLHHKQTDWIYVVLGRIKLVLFDMRRRSKTYSHLQEIFLEEVKPAIVKIPPGVAHGYKVREGPAHIIYLMDREYDPEDEVRIPSDDKRIGYDWETPPKSNARNTPQT